MSLLNRFCGTCADGAFNRSTRFIEGGSLAHSVKSFGELNEDLVAGYVAKILEGLNYLHSQDVRAVRRCKISLFLADNVTTGRTLRSQGCQYTDNQDRQHQALGFRRVPQLESGGAIQR